MAPRRGWSQLRGSAAATDHAPGDAPCATPCRDQTRKGRRGPAYVTPGCRAIGWNQSNRKGLCISVARLQEIPAEFADDDTIYESFGEYCAEIGVEPYPAQDEAFLTILAGDNTIMATPT